jgi:predicted alpha/beta hydrolase family esterase
MLKQQVLVIHGGNAFNSHEEYIAYLHQKEVHLETLQIQGWKDTLGEKLGDAYDVFLIKMPNAQNAKYAEWKIWFEKYLPLLRDNVIFIGHSLGGIFLAKYLAEEQCLKKIRATFLVAAPFNTPVNHPLADFVFQGSLASFNRQSNYIHLYHSTDDLIVPSSSLQNYLDALPNAHHTLFKDRGHFNIEIFPELIADIMSL